MHTYAGINALTQSGTTGSNGTIPATLHANTGVWSTAQVADGGDPRSAANLFIGLEAAIDRTNFLGYRMINWVEGGTYTWTSAVTLANSLTFNGSVSFDNSVQVSVDVEFLNGSLLYGNAAASMTWDGTATFNAAVNAGTSSVWTFGNGSKITGIPWFWHGAMRVTAASGIGTAINVDSGIVVVSGYLGSTVAAPNAIAANNIEKAWAHVTVVGNGSSATVTIDDGFNMHPSTAPTVGQTAGRWYVRLFFAYNFANLYYACTGAMTNGSDHRFSFNNSNVGYVDVFIDDGGIDYLNVGTYPFAVRASGSQ